MGPYNGGQADYLRVPWADFNALTLPEGTAHENDYTMLSDIFPTGWHGVELAKMQPGETIVIYGAGPVGLMAAHAAQIKGAAQVFVVDQQADRLKLAEQIGATPVDRSTGDAVAKVTELTGGGADRGVDAVGYQAHGLDGNEQPEIVLNELIQVVKPTGGIGVVGVYVPRTPARPTTWPRRGSSRSTTALLLQGPVDGHRAGQRQALQRRPARPDHRRQGHPRLPRLPRAAAGPGARGLLPLRQARRRLDQGPPAPPQLIRERRRSITTGRGPVRGSRPVRAPPARSNQLSNGGPHATGVLIQAGRAPDDMDQVVAVTGASGALGGRIAATLADSGTRQLLLGREPARLPVLDAATHRTAAYDDAAAMRSALTGATAMVLVSASLSGRRLAEHTTAIDAAVAAPPVNWAHCLPSPASTSDTVIDTPGAQRIMQARPCSTRAAALRDQLRSQLVAEVRDGVR